MTCDSIPFSQYSKRNQFIVILEDVELMKRREEAKMEKEKSRLTQMIFPFNFLTFSA